MCQLGQLWHGAARRRTRRGGLATKGEPCQISLRAPAMVSRAEMKEEGRGWSRS